MNTPNTKERLNQRLNTSLPTEPEKSGAKFQRGWELWLRSRGAPEQGYAHGERLDGMSQAWTYSQWIQGKWEAWARSLGVTKLGPYPWNRWSTAAMNKGHTRAEFWAWLEENWA